MSTKTTKRTRKTSAKSTNGAAKNGQATLAAYEGDLDVTPVGPSDFEKDDLVRTLRTMMLSRRLDEKMLTLLKQGKGFFHIGASGH